MKDGEVQSLRKNGAFGRQIPNENKRFAIGFLYILQYIYILYIVVSS